MAAAVLVTCAAAVGAVAAASSGGATRRAGSPSAYGVDIQAVYDARGNPSLVANSQAPHGAYAPRWSVCAPPDTTRCRARGAQRLAPASSALTPGATPAGTVFEATAVFHGRVYVARSAAWLGTLHAVAPARIVGRARFGAVVSARAARWAGGWQNETHDNGTGSAGHPPDSDRLSVEACRTARGSRCVNLTPQRALSERRVPVTVGNWFTGSYLFAFDQRLAGDSLIAEPGYTSAAAIPPLRVDATVSRSAPLGPVAGPPVPTVSILPRARVERGRALVARVRCAVSCRVRISVEDDRTGAFGHETFTGARLVGVPRRRLRDGRLSVSLSVGDGPDLAGRSRLG